MVIVIQNASLSAATILAMNGRLVHWRGSSSSVASFYSFCTSLFDFHKNEECSLNLLRFLSDISKDYIAFWFARVFRGHFFKLLPRLSLHCGNYLSHDFLISKPMVAVAATTATESDLFLKKFVPNFNGFFLIFFIHLSSLNNKQIGQHCIVNRWKKHTKHSFTIYI